MKRAVCVGYKIGIIVSPGADYESFTMRQCRLTIETMRILGAKLNISERCLPSPYDLATQAIRCRRTHA